MDKEDAPTDVVLPPGPIDTLIDDVISYTFYSDISSMVLGLTCRRMYTLFQRFTRLFIKSYKRGTHQLKEFIISQVLHPKIFEVLTGYSVLVMQAIKTVVGHHSYMFYPHFNSRHYSIWPNDPQDYAHLITRSTGKGEHVYRWIIISPGCPLTLKHSVAFTVTKDSIKFAIQSIDGNIHSLFEFANAIQVRQQLHKHKFEVQDISAYKEWFTPLSPILNSSNTHQTNTDDETAEAIIIPVQRGEAIEYGDEELRFLFKLKDGKCNVFFVQRKVDGSYFELQMHPQFCRYDDLNDKE